MTAPSPWLRPMQVLAGGLAAAIAALFIAWVRLEPPLPPSAPEVGAAHRAMDARPVDAALQEASGTAGVAPREAADPPPLATAASALLFGVIKRADGTPVSEGGCGLIRDGKQAGGSDLRGGVFAFAGLRPGAYRFSWRIPDELAAEREVMVVAPHTRIDVELPPRWLLHVNAVTPDGAPLVEAIGKQKSTLLRPSVRALAFPEPLTADLPGSTSSEFEAGLGPFRSNDPIRREAKALPKQTVGVLTLPADQPAHIALLLGGVLLAQQQATPGQESVTFVLGPEVVLGKTGTARIRCVDPQGAPVAGARVTIDGASFIGERSLTDAQGVFVAKDLMPGLLSLSVFHEGLRMPPLQFDLPPGADVDLGDIRLQKPVEVEVSYAAFGGDGSLRWCWLDAPANARWRSEYGYHGEQGGVAQKMSLYPGRYGLFARGKNGVAVLEIDTAALPPGPLRVALQPAALLRIDNRIGAGFARYQIATARGVPVLRGELGSRGGYAFELPPGDYVATVEAQTGTAQQRPFVLPARGATLALP